MWHNWFRNMFYYAFQNTLNRNSLVFHILNGPTILAWRIVNRIFQKLIWTIQITEHLENFSKNFLNSSSWPINLNKIVNTLLIITMGLIFNSKAFLKTNLDWVIGPYVAQIIRHTPSTIPIILYTSPPKSWWPGVSTMLIEWPP
jgi:hypothetical protein